MINHEREKGQAKLQDVADRAGVSLMTVSLALRGPTKRMSPGTRERVLEAARELRYQPNARARAFRLGRTNVIGMYAGYGYINVRSPFFTEIVSGLQEGCEAVRKDLLLHGMFHGTAPEDIHLELIDGRIDGLIVTMPPNDPLGTKLLKSGLPTVAVSDAIDGMPCITVDDAGGMRDIVSHLRERGHRRVEFVLSPAQPESALRRRDQFLKSSSEAGIEASVTTIEEDSAVNGLVAGAKGRGVTAFACWNDVVARYMVAAALDQKLRVPDDLAITGFDGCPTPFADSFPLTTVVAPWAEAAREAVHRLDALLRDEPIALHTEFPVRFSIGVTT